MKTPYTKNDDLIDDWFADVPDHCDIDGIKTYPIENADIYPPCAIGDTIGFDHLNTSEPEWSVNYEIMENISDEQLLHNAEVFTSYFYNADGADAENLRDAIEFYHEDALSTTDLLYDLCEIANIKSFEQYVPRINKHVFIAFTPQWIERTNTKQSDFKKISEEIFGLLNN